MVFVRAWVLLARCPPLRVTSVCSSILLWIYCRKRKPCVRSFGRPLAVCVFPWLVPIMMALYLRENWRIILIDLLVMWDRVKPQSPTPVLNVADGATAFFTHAFPGSGFQLHWSPSAQQLSVSGDGHELWRTRASQPFVAIAGATSLVTEDSGNFKFKDRIEWQCVAQRLESVEAVPSGSGSAAIVRGRFDDGSTQCTGLEWQMRFSVAGSHVHFELRLSGATAAHANRVQITHDLGAGVPPGHGADEVAVWGLGVQYRYFNLRGHCVPSFVSEQGIGRGSPSTQPLSVILDHFKGGGSGNDYTTYAASASYITSVAVGVVLENTELSLFDLASDGCAEAGILSGGRFGSTGRVGGGAARRAAARAAGWVAAWGAAAGWRTAGSGAHWPPGRPRWAGEDVLAHFDSAADAADAAGIVITVHAGAMRGRIFGSARPPPARAARVPSAAAEPVAEPVAQSKVPSSRAPTAAVFGHGFVNDSSGVIGRGFVPQSEVLLALETLTEYTGRQRPLPAWADEGAIVGVQGGSDVVRRVVRVLHEAGVPLSAVWMQDWVGARDTLWGSRLWWNWHVDEQVYTDWTALRAELRAQQPPIRMLTYVNSMLSDLGGTPRLRNASRHMFAEAAQQGFLVHAEPSTLHTPPLALNDAAATPAEPSSQVPSLHVPSWGTATSSSAASSAAGSVAPPAAKPHFVEVGGYTAAMLDLTNPRARDWMRIEVFGREMLGDGPGASDGWMADFGEALPCEGVQLHDKSAPCSYHNRYPVEWARLNWEAAEEAGVADDVLIFSRSGYTTSPGVARLFWLGDQLHTWDEHDGFASAVTATLSGGLSGFALTHSDVGGYTSIDHTSLFMTSLVGYKGVSLLRDRELLLRWVEANAFSGAVFRTHEGLLPRDNHQVWTDPETLAHFRRFVLVFRAFRPYRRALMQEAAERGWPLIRHPVLHFPDDPTLLNDRAQADGGEGRIRGFMIGADWLVYPVLEPGVNSVRAYVPSGEWVPLWTSAPTQQQQQSQPPPQQPPQPQQKPPPSTSKGTSVEAERSAHLAESVPVHGHVHGPGWRQLPAPLGQPAVYHRREAPSAQAIREELTRLGVLEPLTWASS